MKPVHTTEGQQHERVTAQLTCIQAIITRIHSERGHRQEFLEALLLISAGSMDTRQDRIAQDNG